MSGDPGEVKNWLPGGEPGKYVTILDLKERWMKKKQEEKEEEEKRQNKLKAAGKEKKVCERLDGLKIGGEEDRVEARRVGVGSGRWKSSGRRRCGTSEGLNSRIDERRVKVEKSEDSINLIDERKWKVEKSKYKEKGLEADDVRVNGDDLNGKYNAKARGNGGGSGKGMYCSGKRFSRDGSSMKGMVPDVTESVGVDVVKSEGVDSVDVVKSEGVDSVGDEKGTRTNCPCHYKSENPGGGGFWVCKYVEQAPRAGGQESVKGTEVVDMVDYVRKNKGWKDELKQVKKHGIPRRVREEMAVEQGKEGVMRVNGDISSIVNHDDVSRKIWQPREKSDIGNGVKEELIAKDTQKVKVAVYKDSQRMINRDGTCQNNDVKLQSETVEPSNEIEEHSQASSITERERIRKGKFRAMDSSIEGRRVYDSGRFKAEKNSGLLPMDCVNKDSIHVNSSCRKMINHDGSQSMIDGSALKLENREPVDCQEKSESPLRTQMGENSSVSFRDTRNGTYLRKTFVNKRLQTERIVANERLTHSGKSYNKRERRLERERLMWVKKGEVSAGDAGGRD